MAKASHALPTAETSSNPAIAAAAAEIHTLINSMPRSPTEAEIVAIIAKAASPLDVRRVRDDYLKSAGHRILSAYLDEIYRRNRTEAEVELHEERFCAEAAAIWAKPCATFADFIVRLSMAIHWNSTPPDPAYPDNMLNDPRAPYFQRALAHVVKGVLDLAGLKFDADGRCIAPECPEASS
jgi:hypothetical protein